MKPDNPEAFWAKVQKSDGCWTWGGSIARGYGIFRIGRKRYFAHRLAYALANGEFDGALKVCHRCDNPPCVRPDHLFLGTQADNIRDMVAKGRNGRTGVKGEAHPAAVLNDELVRTVVGRLIAGESQSQVARSLGVHHGTINRIWLGKTWSHLGVANVRGG